MLKLTKDNLDLRSSWSSVGNLWRGEHPFSESEQYNVRTCGRLHSCIGSNVILQDHIVMDSNTSTKKTIIEVNMANPTTGVYRIVFNQPIDAILPSSLYYAYYDLLCWGIWLHTNGTLPYNSRVCGRLYIIISSICRMTFS